MPTPRLPRLEGWTCHICGKFRPDVKVSVYSKDSIRHGVNVTENVRYCNDNEDCIKRAPTFSHLRG